VQGGAGVVSPCIFQEQFAVFFCNFEKNNRHESQVRFEIAGIFACSPCILLFHIQSQAAYEHTGK